MRALVQRVESASVEVAGSVVGSCGRGLLVLLGVGPGDDGHVAERLWHKVRDLRIFADGRAMTDHASMEYNAACHARKGSTEARQPDDGRFTIVRDFAEWMSRHAHEVEKMCVFFGDPDLASSWLPRFRAIPGVEVVQGSPENIEVTAAGVDKGEALLTLADRLGIPRAQTLAVGDSENDRAMLEKAGVAAVMANGMPQIKALADLVTTADCDHDGVAEVFETLGL